MARTVAARQGAGAVQVDADLVANRRVGEYHHLTFVAPGLAGLARPGQFVSVAVDDGTGSRLLRRAFSIHRVRPAGAYGDVVEVVVSPAGPGTQWLTAQPTGTVVSIVGPLGRPFPLPTEPVPCVLVGGGYGSAPMFWLAEVLRERGCEVHLVLGAASESRLFGLDQARAVAESVHVTTDDGTLGTRGWVSDVVPGLVEHAGAGVIYACGPMGMLRSLSDIAADQGIVAQVAVEEAMACGVGVCMTCVMPVVGRAGTKMVRSCVEGPVFRGDRVRWDAWQDGICHVPADAVGAPAGQSSASVAGVSEDPTPTTEVPR